MNNLEIEQEQDKSSGLFILFVLLSSLGLAGSAAYFSIIGISALFSGAAISVGIMATFLELGKICAASFLFRFFKRTPGFLKFYLLLAVFVLIFITSLGIFGYLTAAFQKSSLDYSMNQTNIVFLETQKPLYQEKIDQARKRIEILNKSRSLQETRLSDAMTNVVILKNINQLKTIQQQTIDMVTQADKDIREENNRIQTTIDEVRKLEGQINKLRVGSSEQKDIQTFKFVADAINWPLETVAKWFILILITVFDPLAICLILSYNVVSKKNKSNNINNNSSNPPSNDKPISDNSESSTNINNPVEELKKTILYGNEMVKTDNNNSLDTSVIDKIKTVISQKTINI